jgi:hypothetical protein
MQAPDKFHVLLRHRLLLEAHGFEGSRAVEEILDSRDAPCGQRVNNPQLCLDLYAAVLPLRDPAKLNDHVATRLVKVTNGGTVRLPRVLDSHSLTKPGFPTSGDFAVWPGIRRHNHHVRVVKRDKRRQVAFIPQLDRATHHVQVLLRHRPRSIPQVQESA